MTYDYFCSLIEQELLKKDVFTLAALLLNCDDCPVNTEACMRSCDSCIDMLKKYFEDDVKENYYVEIVL